MNTRALGRAVTALTGAAAASVLLSGCLYAMIPEPTERPLPDRTSAPDTSGVDAELMSFYGQELEWFDCGGGFDCTYVRAPLDWEDPGFGEIELSVVRHQSEKTPLGSLLLNPGGPGGSGVSLVYESLTFAVGSALIDSYDIIGFDPRGVGESTAVYCLYPDEMDAYLYDIVPGERGSAAWGAAMTAKDAAFAQACEAESGGILPYITTVNSARDMDLLRAVLGDEKLHYLGYSYGTFLGATYAKLYPERVGKLVLDGAIDPSIPGWEVGATQALGFESALRAYMAACLGGRDCPFSGTVDDAMADLGGLLAAVDARPQRASDGRMLGADSLMTGIIAALYAQENWSFLTQALGNTLGGDPDLALYLADFYNGRDQDGYYLDNSSEAFRAYNCMDYPSDDDPAAENAARAKIREGAPTIAPYWEGSDPCEVWPYPATGTREAIRAHGAAPILVVGTTNDPATPYEWSVALAEQLESGVLITRVGEGHTGYNKGNACVDSAVEAYFLSGAVPAGDLRCE